MMATLISSATGNFTAAATWKVADATSLQYALTGTTVCTTSFVNSTSFIPGAITVDGFGVYASSTSLAPSGTFTAELYNTTTSTTIATGTCNVSDINATNGGWIIFPFGPVVLTAGQSYVIRCKTSVGSTVYLWRDATASNWTRVLRTTTTAAPGAADLLIVAGETTGAGTGTTYTVTMDNTAGTTFGVISATVPSLTVSKYGVLDYGTAASTNYRLVLAGLAYLHGSGTLNMGTSGTPIPATSTATLEFAITTLVDGGLVVRKGGTFRSYGTNTCTVTRALLAANLSAAGTVLTTDVSTGWKSGDEIAIAPTARVTTEGELRSLSIDASGTTVTISAGVTNAHLGYIDADPRYSRQAEVINLTRNVKVFGTSASLCSYIHVEEALILTFPFADELPVGVTLTGTPTVTCESIGSVVDPAPASFIVDATLVGSNIDIAVAGQVQGADYEIRVTSATTNPLLTLTRVGRIYVF
jgi:hypothetical protein